MIDLNRSGIMFACESNGSFDIACRMIKNFDFKAPLYLYAPDKILQNSGQSCLELFDHYTSNPSTIPGLLSHIKLVFLGAHESTPYCKTLNAIGFIAKKTNTSVVSIQHGWIQPGLNFKSKIKNVDYVGVNTDNSRSLHHFSPILKFFGECGIGFPASKQREQPVKNSKSQIIIATNFNWGVYSDAEFEEFSRSVVTLCQHSPAATIYHRPHPAERGAKNPKLLFDHTGRQIPDFQETPEASELCWPTMVVTTPSTIALDYLTAGVKALIYTPKRFVSFLDELQLNSISFSSAEELRDLLDNINIKPISEIPLFPTSEFMDLVESLHLTTKEFTLDEEDYMKYCAFVIPA